MGPPSLDARSPPGARSFVSKLSFSEDENAELTQKFESSDVDSSENESLPNDVGSVQWNNEALENLAEICKTVANDDEFDRLNNKLLIALKLFVTKNPILCVKCMAMKMVTKRGKTNKTYQFNCGSHTVSAGQILSTLPDNFIKAHLPAEPMHVFNETLQWIGKDHLCPELVQSANLKKASKRYSGNRSPMKGISNASLLLRTRNLTNESLMEIKQLRERLDSTEQQMGEYSSKFNRVLMENDLLNEQVRNLKNENQMLKKYMASEKETESIKPDDALEALVEELKAMKEENFLLKKYLSADPIVRNNTKSATSTTNIGKSSNSFSEASSLIRPEKPKRLEKSAIDIISKYEYKHQTRTLESAAIETKKETPQFSPLTLVFFEGCYRKSAAEYRSLLDQIGFDSYLARDISFIAEDILQIATFESVKQNLISKLTAVSDNVKFLKDFNPSLGISYAKYSKFTDEQASLAYYKLMAQNAARLEQESRKNPSLKRTALYFKKLASLKNFELKPADRVKRVFCLDDFITEPKPQGSTESRNDEIISSQDSTLSLPSISQVLNIDTPKEMEVDSTPAHAI